jgi:hypothetical protein
MTANTKPQSPYVGLIPYTPQDAAFFFGRENETEIICANLRSAHLTVLYGSSGVGKSSVLQAGVVHNLRELAKEDLKTYGQAEFAVVFFNNWAGDPLKGLANAIHEAVAHSLGIEPEMLECVPETNDLVKILHSWSVRYGLELLIILDQFEELFNYLTGEKRAAARFADELTKAVNAPNLPVRFLLSLRGDTLSRLDYFKESIPNLLENRLQLHHLADSEARRAIAEPVRVYNEMNPDGPKYEIEPALVDEVLEQVKIGRVEKEIEQSVAGAAAAAVPPPAAASAETRVETPYLQLVMKRIWREEVNVGSNGLRLETLTRKLGGARNIVQTHLNEVMDSLTDEERRVAAKCFEFLVTPMGTKAALTAGALAKYTRLGEESIDRVLETLISGKDGAGPGPEIDLPVSEQKASISGQPHDRPHILKTVEIAVSQEKRLQAYEVTHGALIPAILAWRARYEIDHGAWQQVKKLGKIVLPVAAILALVFLILFWKANSAYYGQIIQEKTLTFNSNLQILETEKTDLQTQVNTEKDLAEISKVAEKQAKVEAKSGVNASSAELIDILIKLSNPSVAERETAIRNLKKLIEEGKVPEEYENSIIRLVAGIDAQKAADLRSAAANVNKNVETPDERIAPRVYLHIIDENQRASAQAYGRLLESNDFRVPGIENVGSIRLSSTQLRYFRQKDAPLAERVAQLLKGQGIENTRIQYISGYEDSNAVRPKHLELWFAADAFSK